MKRKYTEEHIKFLSDNVSGMTLKELTEKFNEKFDFNTSEASIKYLKYRWNLNSGIISRFGISFKNGTERIDKRGYTNIKIEGKWIKKGRYIYEQAHGKIPKGYKIIFKDGNRSNFDLDNLAMVSDSELMLINKKSLYKRNKELTETGILIARLLDKTRKHKK